MAAPATIAADRAAPPPINRLASSVRAPLGLVLVLGALTAFGPVSIDMYLPALPAIGASLNATPAATQRTVAAFFIGISLGQLVYGPLSDRIGRRIPLLVGVALYLFASAGCALAPSIDVLLGFRILQALGGCAGMVVARAVVRDRFEPHEVLHVLSLLMLVMGVAPLLAPLLGGWLLLLGSWRMIFGAQALFAFAVGTAVFFALPESRSEETAAKARGEHPLRSYLALLSNPRLAGYVLAGAFSGAALFAYISTSPDVVIGLYHVPAQAFGWVFGINAFGLIGGTQVNARLARRWPSDLILRRANLITFICSLVLLACALTGFAGLWGVLVPLFFVIGSLGFSQSNATAGALGADPHRAGATSALLGAASFGCGAGSAAVASLIRDGSARPMAIVIVGSLAIAVIALRTLVKPADASA